MHLPVNHLFPAGIPGLCRIRGSSSAAFPPPFVPLASPAIIYRLDVDRQTQAHSHAHARPGLGPLRSIRRGIIAKPQGYFSRATAKYTQSASRDSARTGASHARLSRGFSICLTLWMLLLIRALVSVIRSSTEASKWTGTCHSSYELEASVRDTYVYVCARERTERERGETRKRGNERESGIRRVLYAAG